MKKILVTMLCICLASSASLCAKGAVSSLPDNWEMVNAPTAYTLLRGCYSLSTRIYENGGLYARWNFGFMGRLLLGLGFTVNNAIGRGDMDGETPRLGFRLRVLDEHSFPSLAIGWDQRGYGAYRAYAGGNEHFALGEKGAYVVASKEVGMGGGVIQLHGGGNVVEVEDFEADEIRFFVGAIVAPVKEIILTLEGDDLFDEDGAAPVTAVDGTVTSGGRSHKPRLNGRLAVCFDEMLTIAIEGLDLTGEDDVSRMLFIDYKNYF